MPLALNSIYDMVIKRKKRVSKGRTLAFAKRLCTLSLQMLHNGSASSLALVREISNNHANIQQLLDSEHEVIYLRIGRFQSWIFITKNADFRFMDPVFLSIISVNQKSELWIRKCCHL